MWRLARAWWAGFTVFYRWVAFWIVLSILWLPAAGLAYLLGDDTGPTFVVLFAVLCGPIVFYLTSRYLLLLGDDDHAVEPAGESPADTGRQEDRHLRRKIVLSAGVAYLAVVLLTLSPDPLTGLVPGTAAAFLCGIPLLILARSRFLKAASDPIHSLVCALVCLTAVLLVMCLLLFQRITHFSQRANALDRSSPNSLTASSLP